MADSERKFLHDLATPITVVDAVSKTFLKKLKPALEERDLESLERLRKNVEKLKELVRARREILSREQGGEQ